MTDVASAQRELRPVQNNDKIFWPPGLGLARMGCDQARMMACRADVGESRSQVRVEMNIKGVCNPNHTTPPLTLRKVDSSRVSPRNE